MSLILAIGGIIYAFKLIYTWIFKQKVLMDIPGPKGWPIIGNALQMDPVNLHKTFWDCSRKYGDIFKIKIFNNDAVVLSDYESIRQMLTSESCSSRPYIYRLHEIALKDLTNISMESFSAEWNDRKKALSRSMNAYGEGMKNVEDITLDYIDKLFDAIQEDARTLNKGFDLYEHIHVCTAGVITALFYGKKLEETKLIELLGLERGPSKLLSQDGLVALLDLIPWMRHLPLKSIQDPIRDVELFRKWVFERHIEMKDESAKNEQGILGALKLHVNRITLKPMTTGELLGMTTDTIMAGFATSTASLYSLILTLINFPDIQEKMYAEIQQVTKGKRPRVSDRSSMIYVKAVMEESFRYSSVLPLGIPHFSSEDTSIVGKHIPRETTLLANFWRLHHDERYFDDPWNFKPERFLTPDGQKLPNDDSVFRHCLPFSAGRRICPGEGLARNRIFLVIVSLLQRFKFLPEDPQNVPSCDPRLYDSELVLKPFRYKVKVIER